MARPRTRALRSLASFLGTALWLGFAVLWYASMASFGLGFTVGVGVALLDAVGWKGLLAVCLSVPAGLSLLLFVGPIVHRQRLPRSDEWLVDHRRARLIARDEFGVLWAFGRRSTRGPHVAVEVEDATPRMDGSHRRYFLAVPPQVETPHEAVAWTFGFDQAAEYRPLVET